MSPFHALAKPEMVASVEVLVSRHTSMMMLNQRYFPFDDLCFEPRIKFRQIQQYKFSYCFHTFISNFLDSLAAARSMSLSLDLSPALSQGEGAKLLRSV
jgi:hypothetical protein